MTVLFDYAIALTNLNGVIDKEKVLEIYNKQNKETKSLADIDLLMGKEEKNLEENFVRVEGNYFVHEAIFNVNEINELLAKKADKPYYIPTKKLLLRYTDDEFYEETPESKKVYRMLEKYVESHNANTLEDIFFDVQMSCEMENDPIYIMNYLHDMDVIFPSQKEGLEALSLITDLSNNTRIWSNNGFTANEVYIQEEKPKLKTLTTAIKTGRNDPCHCGSGKKYKNCCLLNE